jgi:hypothetical protein
VLQKPSLRVKKKLFQSKTAKEINMPSSFHVDLQSICFQIVLTVFFMPIGWFYFHW